MACDDQEGLIVRPRQSCRIIVVVVLLVHLFFVLISRHFFRMTDECPSQQTRWFILQTTACSLQNIFFAN